MTTTGPRLLFVYGTLQSTASGAMGRDQRARLESCSRIAGRASTAGFLFDLGGYPGLVPRLPDQDGKDESCEAIKGIGMVRGELRELAEPDAVFNWLDLYEGIGVNAEETDAYRRVIQPVIRHSASACETLPPGRIPAWIPAWIYVYQGSLTKAHLLPSGIWQA